MSRALRDLFKGNLPDLTFLHAVFPGSRIRGQSASSALLLRLNDCGRNHGGRVVRPADPQCLPAAEKRKPGERRGNAGDVTRGAVFLIAPVERSLISNLTQSMNYSPGREMEWRKNTDENGGQQSKPESDQA